MNKIKLRFTIDGDNDKYLFIKFKDSIHRNAVLSIDFDVYGEIDSVNHGYHDRIIDVENWNYKQLRNCPAFKKTVAELYIKWDSRFKSWWFYLNAAYIVTLKDSIQPSFSGSDYSRIMERLNKPKIEE